MPPRRKKRPDPVAVIERMARKLYSAAVEQRELELRDWDETTADTREVFRRLALRRLRSEETIA